MSISCYIADLLGTGARYVAPTADLPKPETPSSDWHAMAGTWCKIDDILAGADRVRSSGSSGSVAGPHVPYANLRNLNRGRYISGESKYLPRYSEESGEEYVRRLAAAPWRPEYADALNSLSKPFAKPVTLQGEVSAIVCQPKHSCIQIANDAASYGPDGAVGAFKASQRVHLTSIVLHLLCTRDLIMLQGSLASREIGSHCPSYSDDPVRST